MATAVPWAMRIRTDMADPRDLLRLVQWLSPAFPVGGYAWSQGLEQAITDGDIHDASGLQDWVGAVLSHGAGRLDAILLAQTRMPDADLASLADLACAMAGSAERWTETRDMGRAFGLAITAITGSGQPALPYPLAVGLATRGLNVTTPEVLGLYLQGLAAMLVSAAVRFMPLGQTDGQRVLQALLPLLVRLAEEYAVAPLTEAYTSTVRAEMAAMRHETLDVRIYRS